MYLLPLTAALHYLAIIPVLLNTIERRANRLTRIYIGTIVMATTASIIWHLNSESKDFLLILDYTLAALWFMVDYLWMKCLNQPIILELNINVIVLYVVSIFYANYNAAHSAWHVISAAKCVYVSYIIYMNDKL